jgi:glycosyltransferase involved in cell wall biosynthesis
VATGRGGLTVVVPTRDRPNHLTACLDALRADLDPGDEVIVVDSCSAVPTTMPGTRVLRCDRPGASLARNTGWRAATHALIAFVDDDVRVLPGWSDALVSALSEDVTFVTGGVGVPAGQEGRERPVAVTTLPTRTVLTADTRGTIGASANLGVRRTSLEAVGGFDERLGPGTWTRAAEDLELLDRLLALGPGLFEPAAAAVHEQWRSRRELVRLDLGYGTGLGARLWLLGRGRRRPVFADAVWQGTVRTGLRDLRAGYRFGVLTAGARLLGVVTGFARAAARLR